MVKRKKNLKQMIFNGMNELLYFKNTIESHLNYGKWLTYALNIKKMVRI